VVGVTTYLNITIECG